MINKEDLQKLGVSEDKQDQVLELLGDAAKKLSSENEAKTAYDNVDRAILTLTGVSKSTNQTTTDYLKSAVTGDYLNNKISEKTDSLNGEITQLKEQLKNHKGDETLKQKIKELEDEKAKLPDLKNEWIKEWKDKATSYEQEISSMKRNQQLKELIPTNFRSDLDDDFLNFKIDQALKEAERFGKIEKGNDGKVYLLDEVNVDKVVGKEWFESKFDQYLDKGNNQAGGGAGQQQRQNNNGSGSTQLEFKEGMSKGEKVNVIRTHLITQEGLSEFGDPKYQERLNQLMVEHGVAKEPQKQ
jgi:hypothetical protein